ncbi:MAG: FHA domain-containing protein, partial [Myxococcales bacterium]|nr:FHA domain-containing protein [Myxococcales bacterium]
MTDGSSQVTLTFNIYQGDQLVRTERLNQNVIKVGKLPSSHLRIDDETVSKMHAVIEVTGPGEIHVIDLGSTAGTLVNGQKVNKHQLQSGDELTFGGARVQVTIEAASASSSAAPPGGRTMPLGVSGAPSSGAVPSAAPPPPAGALPPSGRPPARSSVPSPSVPVPPPLSGRPAGGSNAPVDPESVSYTMVASGPAVSPEEVETGDQAVEVVIMWGARSVIHVSHLSPPRPFAVGDESNAKGKATTDFLIGSEALGTSRLPVVVESGGGVAVVIPEGATGSVSEGNQSVSLADLQRMGRTQPCSEVQGAVQ